MVYFCFELRAPVSRKYIRSPPLYQSVSVDSIEQRIGIVGKYLVDNG